MKLGHFDQFLGQKKSDHFFAALPDPLTIPGTAAT